jgi:trehalose 6-phosphate synthase/phosphatase
VTESGPPPRLIVASNRLPLVVTRGEDGHGHGHVLVEAGSGGLVTALLPVLGDRGGTWVGWPGVCGDVPELAELLAGATRQVRYDLRPVPLSEEERRDFYYGFSNEIIWPLFHDLLSYCRFEPSYWQAYRAINRRYARLLAQECAAGDLVWVHDYHLMNVARELRALGVTSRLAFFLHTPFPPLDIYLRLPWRATLITALLDYDLLGFQTLRDRRNFLQCVRHLVPEAKIHGQGPVLTARLQDREVRIGSFPISIDFNDFVKRASAGEVACRAAELRATLPNRQLILGVDRLDYTKGIPHRLEAFRNALQRYPVLHERVTLIQVVVPSREDVAGYHELKTHIERLVGEINGQFTRPGGWVPIHYVFRSLADSDLLAYYRAAEIALVTPLKDGMNLVAKEYCACSIEEDCVLILSEFAGAAAQLRHGALTVNPYDLEGVADAIYRAFTMNQDERRARMRRLRRSIREHDVFDWVSAFSRAAVTGDLAALRHAGQVPGSEPETWRPWSNGPRVSP